MKIVSIVGARPQFIKYSPVAKAAADVGIESVLIHTGQHYDANMSDVCVEDLSIAPPRHHLGVGSAPHGWQTGQIMMGLENALIDERPDWVLVFGDTNSTLAGALVAAKLGFPLAHIEAGLRSFNRRMPEEINRVVVDHVSNLLFAPTEIAVLNLRNEGISSDAIVLVGDVMLDAALMFGPRAEERSQILQRLGSEPQSYALATIHRAENTDNPDRLAAILEGLTGVCRHIPVVFPYIQEHEKCSRHPLRLPSNPLVGC